jgi:hypothetical protein
VLQPLRHLHVPSLPSAASCFALASAAAVAAAAAACHRRSLWLLLQMRPQHRRVAFCRSIGITLCFGS